MSAYIVPWVSRHWKTLATIGIPTLAGFAGGVYVGGLKPTYNSGGAPIVVQGSSSGGFDMSSMTNMMMMVMMMSMMLPMIRNSTSKDTSKEE